MFLRLHPSTLVRNGFALHPVGDRFFFNINRIGYAHFRLSTERDQGGLGAAADQIPPETPCLDVSIEGSPNAPAHVTLFFPGALQSEYERLLRIIEDRVV
jgi:hypothetical protein